MKSSSKKKIIIWQEESAITEIDAEILSEDHYIDEANDLDGCSPLSEIK
jgi:hypothetical protein